MARRPRLKLACVPNHIIQRGDNRGAVFFTDSDHETYLEYLGEACKKYDVHLHAYVLMTNHVHLLVTPTFEEGVSELMKQLGLQYVQYVNRAHARSGTLWEGRFRSCLVGEEYFFLGCQRYIELNPVRAGLVENPADYRWSSYRRNALGETNARIIPHRLYKRLGADLQSRLEAYRNLFREPLDAKLVDQIRKYTNGGFVVGSERFQEDIAKITGMRTWRLRPGRPTKT
ncbi:MAG: transposase [Methylococcales bacterium]